MRRILLLFAGIIFFTRLLAQPDTVRPRYPEFFDRVIIEGYGAMNYYHFDWQTDTAKRDAIDNERFVLELKYRWNDRIRLHAEIEIEHGGTGTDLEFDRFEEFGEFEFDVTKGGEVLLEQLHLEFGLGKNWMLRVGRVKVPFGLMFTRDEPTDYPTADNRPDFDADGREWRTPPLWGIGLTKTVGGHTNFLHDGRARSLEEAVLWHGGEGENAKEAFRTMGKKERVEILKFLESL